MKVNMGDPIQPRRGDPVAVGNVYANAHGRPFYRVVVGIVARETRGRPWNNVVCLHVSSVHGIVGSSNVPQDYLAHHNDLIGKVQGEMPELTIEFTRPHPQQDKIDREGKI